MESTTKTPLEKPTALVIGLTPDVTDWISSQIPGFELLIRPYASEILEEALNSPIHVVICGPCTIDVPTIEVAQSLRMLYASIPVYFVTKDRTDFQREALQKNGFTDGFLLPNDEFEILRSLRRDLSNATSGRIKAFRKIQLVDVVSESKLGFDLYIHLPANNKKIRYVSATESLGAEKADKLKKHHHQTALITEDQVKEFYQFTARQLKNLNKGAMSETERTERREKAVRDLLTGLFSSNSKDNIDIGREMMADCQEIIKAYVLDDSKEQNSWYERLLAAAAANTESTAYTKAANTSTYAALLSMALGIGDPKDLALAGLLHDIGLTTVPPEITAKDPKTWTPEEKLVYEQHPTASIRLIKERRMSASEKVCSIIEQHHERFDGSGFPNKMPGPRVLKEAQVLGIADRLEEMTALKEGRPRMLVPEAIEAICDEELKNPGASAFHPELLRKLKAIFVKK